MAKKRILTGDRPTGPLHLGHLVGSLRNRVALQDEYETFILVADLHLLTTRTNKEDLRKVEGNIKELMYAYLAVGLDPKKVTFYLQSQIPEVTELFTIFNMLVTVPRAQRIPTLKDVLRDLHINEPSVGLLAYPILQAADILMVNANAVPVGKDQDSHIELTREIARTFNREFGSVFNEPEAIIGEVPSLVGLDGKAKMSKSLGNCIFLFDDSETVEKKVMEMFTDPNRIHANDPGKVEDNPVFIYHDAFNPDKTEVEILKERYKKGNVGDVEVKQKLAKKINTLLSPLRERRKTLERNSGEIGEILKEGTKRARREAQMTLDAVKRAMKIDYF